MEASPAKLVMSSCADGPVSKSRYVTQSNATDVGGCRRETRTAQCHFDRLGQRSTGGGGGFRRQSSGVASVAAARRVSKKYRSNREYLRLKAILPAVSGKRTVSKLTVIEEAIRYIDHLHATLASRLGTDGHQLNDGDTKDRVAPEEFVRQLCFGSFFNDRLPTDRLPSDRRDDRDWRRPLAERPQINESRTVDVVIEQFDRKLRTRFFWSIIEPCTRTLCIMKNVLIVLVA